MEKGLCAAIGDFDGVHLGHCEVINAAVNNKYGHTPAVYTFEKNCKNARIITDNKTKRKLIEQLGVKEIIFDDFTAIKNLSPEKFIKEVLIDKYGIASIVCGTDFRFGKNASGDTELLKKLAKEHNIGFEAVKQYTFMGEKLSSSKIRELISAGDMDSVEAVLGHRYSVSGKVIHGKHLGTKNKAPTVNIEFEKSNIVPAYGVYVTKVDVGGEIYNAISNVGIRPSVETGRKPNVETHIFGFDKEIYGQDITVEFIKMIRPEIKFRKQDLLFEQIRKDIQMAKTYFNGENNE